MANPVEFKEQNHSYGKPLGMTEEECSSLPCFVFEGGVISKWQLSAEELAEVNRTGCIYINVLQNPPPPICVIGETPFNEVDNENNR